MYNQDILGEGVDLLSREALYIDMRRWEESVSYTHLTLPTFLRV